VSQPNDRRGTGKIVADLLDAATAAAEIVARGRNAGDEDRLLRLAGEAVISRIGDAASKLPDSVQAAMPSVPWEEIRANRFARHCLRVRLPDGPDLQHRGLHIRP
jgi:uncharacterized protein with HEPN domain